MSASPATIVSVDEFVAEAVREGLTLKPKRLPAWLFYDAAGSRLFDQITELPEYYLTRTERGILTTHAKEMLALAADGARLRIAELGAGSAEKTRILLKATVERQGEVIYEPVDVSASALEGAKKQIEGGIPGVAVVPRIMDYTHGDGRRFQLGEAGKNERRLMLYIGSSIGNFEPGAAMRLLRRVRAGLKQGDGFLLGVDLVKEKTTLVNAYSDAAGVTAAFNRNILIRLNAELDADFDPDAFAHRAVWNSTRSRMEMHLVSQGAQQVRLEALNMTVNFARGETIHTENSYKYQPGQAETMLVEAGFVPAKTWTDQRGWFAVCLGCAD